MMTLDEDGHLIRNRHIHILLCVTENSRCVFLL
jgi:hypothetical protein